MWSGLISARRADRAVAVAAVAAAAAAAAAVAVAVVVAVAAAAAASAAARTRGGSQASTRAESRLSYRRGSRGCRLLNTKNHTIPLIYMVGLRQGHRCTAPPYFRYCSSINRKQSKTYNNTTATAKRLPQPDSVPQQQQGTLARTSAPQHATIHHKGDRKSVV